MPRAVRFFTSGVSRWRSSTTKSRIRSQPARAASVDGLPRGRKLPPHRLHRGDRTDLSAGSVRNDQTVARYLALIPASAATSASDAPAGPAPRDAGNRQAARKIVGVIGPLPLVKIDDPPHAVLVAIGVGDHRVRCKGEPPRLQDEMVGDPCARLPGISSPGPATWPAIPPSYRIRPRWRDRRGTPASAGGRRPSGRVW